MESIAGRDRVIELGNFLTEAIPRFAKESNSSAQWTNAAYESLKEYRYRDDSTRNWKIYPEEKCYKGEYLCDFTLFEEGYGCRIACESQWSHWSRVQKDELAWAFDKLRGVKSDIKLFIFEGTNEIWEEVYKKYLSNYAQLSIEEAFLALRWHVEGQQKGFLKSWWQPQQNGKQENIKFVDF